MCKWNYRMASGVWMRLLAICFVFLPGALLAEARFPQPQFDTGHLVPVAGHPAVWQVVPAWADALILVVVLLVTAWAVLARRSVRLVLLLAVLCLGWFGFIRHGCICPVGSTQNLALAACGAGGLPWLVGFMFAVPLLVALFFGRVFCAAVCPLGAMQELAIVRAQRVPRLLDAVLRLVPVVVLAVAVLMAANNAGFPVCKTDPFVGFFRRSAPWHMLLAGVVVLLLGTVIARPYCRYYCPYGVLLGWCARFAWKPATITPTDCDNCRLCESVCPIDAILPPRAQGTARNTAVARRRLLFMLLLAPVLVAGGALAGQFVASQMMQPHFRFGATIAGAFLGMVLAWRLIALARLPVREFYTVDAGRCVSCGRCFAVCPRHQQWLKRAQVK